MMIVELDQQGRIIIPVDIADAFNLVEGSKLELIKKKCVLFLKPIKNNKAA